MKRFALLLGCALAAAALFATSAFAATTRFASPTGLVSMTATCTDPTPTCSLGTALGAARTGDTISLANGSYDLAGKTLPAIPLHWVPTDPTTRPILTSNSTVPTLTLTAAQSGSTFDHLELDNRGPQTMSATATALLATGSTDVTVRSSVLSGLHCVIAVGMGTFEIDDSAMNGTAASTCLQVSGPNMSVRRSTVQGPDAVISRETIPQVAAVNGLIEDTTVSGGLLLGPNGVARRVRSSGTIGILGQGLVVDSFALGFGAGGAGIEAGPNGGTMRVVGTTAIGKQAPALLANGFTTSDPEDPNKLVVTDTIASSNVMDIQASPAPPCSPDFVCEPGLIVVDHSLFTTRAPLATAPAANVITTGAGNRTGDPRFTDPIRNNYRLLPGSPAIDAGVVDAALAPSDLDGRARVQGSAPDLGAFETTPQPGAGGPGGSGGPGSGPKGSGPNTRATVALSGVAIKPSHFHVDGRAKIQFNLDKAASVKLTFARQVKKGHRKTFRTVGHLTVSKAKAGKNTVLFLGRVGGKALRRGRYRLTVAPSGGKPRSVLLTVLP